MLQESCSYAFSGYYKSALLQNKQSIFIFKKIGLKLGIVSYCFIGVKTSVFSLAASNYYVQMTLCAMSFMNMTLVSCQNDITYPLGFWSGNAFGQ